MKVANETLKSMPSNYAIGHLAPPDRLLFFDIETTGFSAAASHIYLIGCAFCRDGKWQIRQYFAENPREEAPVLKEFLQFAKDFQMLVHFNGSTFDLPFLAHKCGQYRLPNTLESMENTDIYKRVAPLRRFLKLPNCRQKTLEEFLDIRRKDIYSGGDLISVYQRYVKEPDPETAETLLLHNADDLKGMLAILPMLSYYDIFTDKVVTKKAQSNRYTDINGTDRQELLLTIRIPFPLPKPVSASANGCYFTAFGQTGSLRVPVYEEEMKYFYDNYKDYYYLPAEDVALHKSVAGFVDREYRVQATAATCYTRKQSLYLPQWDFLIKPYFRRDYRSRELFFELTDEIKRDRQLFTDYANHVLEMIVSSY